MEIERSVEIALGTIQSLGASYGDVRICRIKNEQINTREQRVKDQVSSLSMGLGIRVLLDGSWGFAATSDFSEQKIKKAAKSACDYARATRNLRAAPVTLTKSEIVKSSWTTPVKKNPFEVPKKEIIDFLLEINAKALKLGAQFCDSHLWTTNEWKHFASTEGTSITQDLYRIWAQATPTIVNSNTKKFETRTTLTPPLGCGYEAIDQFQFVSEIERAVAHAKQKLLAPSVSPGLYDLILHPSHLWLTIHETCGHATELDRALGFEANFAGTSFLTPDKLGKLQYGSELVNIVGNRNEPLGLASCAFDDEGVKTSEFPIIQSGTFVNYQTSREQASLLSLRHSFGCAYADSWAHVPIQRMPNISLQPGKEKKSVLDLIEDTENGIYILGDGSWSIDQQRYNFQFTGQEFWHVKNGKIQGMLRDVAYQGKTTEFWNSCDAICDRSEYQLGGSFFCGKGQPCQVAPVSHGSSPARFRHVRVINTSSVKT